MKLKKIAAAAAAFMILCNTTSFAQEYNYENAQRSEMVESLWRAEGMPKSDFAISFKDVSDDDSAAVSWAEKEKIVSGVSAEKFMPEKAITLEEAVSILYRYAEYKNIDVSVWKNTNILSYNDVFEVSGYAVEAFQWVCGSGLINSSDGYLNPKKELSIDELLNLVEKTTTMRKAVLTDKLGSIELKYRGGEDFVISTPKKQAEIKIYCTINDEVKPHIELADVTGDGKNEICIFSSVKKGESYNVESLTVLDEDTLEEEILPTAFEMAENALTKNNDGTYTVNTGKNIYNIKNIAENETVTFGNKLFISIENGKIVEKVPFEKSNGEQIGMYKVEYAHVDGGFIGEKEEYTAEN